MANTYYCVTSSFDNHGRMTADITDTKYLINRRPEGSFKSTNRCDIYTDWLTDEEIKTEFPELAKRYDF